MALEMNRVNGKNCGDVKLFALSTCIWCMRTKRLLGNLGVTYSYVDVDLLDEDARAEAMRTVRKHNPSGSFPTLLVNDDTCIVGYKENSMKEVRGLAE